MNAKEANLTAKENALTIVEQRIANAAYNGQTQASGYWGISPDCCQYVKEELRAKGYSFNYTTTSGNSYISVSWSS